MRNLFKRMGLFMMGAFIAFSSVYQMDVLADAKWRTITLMDEDFSGFDDDFEFISNATDNTKWENVASEGAKKHTDLWAVTSTNSYWTAQLGSSAVVKKNTDSTNKYLSFKHYYDATNIEKPWPFKPRITRKIVNNTTLTPYKLPNSGTLKISVKIKANPGATESSIGSFPIFAIAGKDASKTNNGYTWIGAGDDTKYFHALSVDSQGMIYNKNFSMGTSFKPDRGDGKWRLSNNEWHTVVFEYDLGSGAGKACKISADDKLLSTYAPLNGSNVSNMDELYGLTFASKDGSCGGADAVICYDDLKIELVTKAEELSYAVSDSGFNTDGNAYSADICINNYASEPKDILCIVAAYGDYDELLGVFSTDCGSVNTAGQKDVKATISDINQSEVKSVRAYIWNTYSNMKPYVAPIQLFQANAG